MSSAVFVWVLASLIGWSVWAAFGFIALSSIVGNYPTNIRTWGQVLGMIAVLTGWPVFSVMAVIIMREDRVNAVAEKLAGEL